MIRLFSFRGVTVHWWHWVGAVPAGITAQGPGWRLWVDFGHREWIPLFMAFRRVGPVTVMWGNRRGSLDT